MGSHQVLHHQKLLEWHWRIFQTAGYVENCLYIVETEHSLPSFHSQLFICLFICLFIYYLIANSFCNLLQAVSHITAGICRKVEKNKSNIASLELSASAQCTSSHVLVKFNSSSSAYMDTVHSFQTPNTWHIALHGTLHMSVTWHFTEVELLEEEAEMNQVCGDPGKGGLRRRRRTYSRTLPEHLKSGKQYGQDPNQHRDGNMGT